MYAKLAARPLLTHNKNAKIAESSPFTAVEYYLIEGLKIYHQADVACRL